MIIRFLGTHNEESCDTRLVSLLIDDVLAVDAGSLVSELAFTEQENIRAILLSHGHYDHIRAVPAFAFNNYRRTTSVFATQPTLEILASHLVDGLIYPKFTEKNSFLEKPALKLCHLEAFKPQDIEGYQVTPVPVNHPIETVGFAITSSDEKKLLYITDTGPGLDRLWEHVSPDILIIETTYPDRLEKVAWDAGHLCPQLLMKELVSFRRVSGYLPRVILIHMNPRLEGEIRDEVERVSQELGISIGMAKEGDRVVV
ncbi:MBL fold metallo-hydrolase [Chloroflexota bacterium]